MSSLAEVDDVAGTAWYIDNYLNTQSYHARKHIMSAGWVFPGWTGFSRYFKKELGVYSPRQMLIDLGRTSKAGREEDTSFGLYQWENRRRK
jgi:hypothetical protein